MILAHENLAHELTGSDATVAISGALSKLLSSTHLQLTFLKVWTQHGRDVIDLQLVGDDGVVHDVRFTIGPKAAQALQRELNRVHPV